MEQKRVKASDVIGSSYYNYELTSTNNTPSKNSTISITCKVTNIYGQAVNGKSVTLYLNNTSQGAKTTGSDGSATWNNISMTTGGLQVFSVENSKIEVFVDNKSEIGHTHSQYLTQHQDISGKIDTAGTGLSKSETTLNHSNSITAQTTNVFKKFKYDAQGHITGTTDVSASDLPSHTHSGYATTTQVSTLQDSVNGLGQTIDGLADIAETGDYDDLINAPTDISAFNNDVGYLTTHQNISSKEDKSNKVTSISSSSTDAQYPSAKCVYDLIGNITTIINGTGGNS